MMTHTQALLQKENSFQTAWIPSEFAVPGRYLKLRSRGECWDNGWIVVNAGTILDTTFVNERTQDYKNMRRMTDI